MPNIIHGFYLALFSTILGLIIYLIIKELISILSEKYEFDKIRNILINIG